MSDAPPDPVDHYSGLTEQVLERLVQRAHRLGVEPLARGLLKAAAAVLTTLMTVLARCSGQVREVLDHTADELCRQGRLMNALPLRHALYLAQRHRLGAGDTQTAASARALATLMAMAGQHREALQLQHESHAAVTGPDCAASPDAALGLQALAYLHYMDGDPARALHYASAAVNASRECSGDDAELTMAMEQSRAVMLLQAGEFKQARDAAAPLYRRLRGTLPLPHLHSLPAGSVLAGALYCTGDGQEARALLEELCALTPPDDFGLIVAAHQSRTYLALLLAAEEDSARAHAVYCAGLRRALDRPGTPPLVTLEFVVGAIIVLARIGDFDLALELAREQLPVCQAHLAPDHPLALRLHFALAVVHAARNDAASAVRCLQDMEQALGGTWPIDHPITTEALRMLVACRRGEGAQAAAHRAEDQLVQHLLARPVWFDSLFQGLFLLLQGWLATARHEGAAALEPCREPLAQLGRRLSDELELCDTSELARLGADQTWRGQWLQLCALPGLSGHLPLAPLYGTEAWLGAVDAAAASPQDSPAPHALLDAFLSARRALGRWRAELDQQAFPLLVSAGAKPGQPPALASSAWVARAAGWTLSPSATVALPAGGMERERQLIDAVRQTRAALDARSPEFDTLSRARRITSADLCAGLPGDEAVLLLLQAGEQLSALSVLPGAAHVRLHELGAALLQILRTPLAAASPDASGERTLLVAAPDGVLRLALPEAPEGNDPDGAVPSTLERSRALRAGLWSILQRAHPGVRTWHVITGPHLHALPFDLGRPAELSASYYCGLPAWLRLQANAPGGPGVPTDLALLADAAEAGPLPIPFAAVEQQLVRRLASRRASCGASLTVGLHPAAELASGALPERHWSIACHGQLASSLPPPRRDAPEAFHGVLCIDSAHALSLGPAGILALKDRPGEVYLSACVGGHVGDTRRDDPLGIVSALQLRGVEAVVAALAPIPDFWAPLLAGLYWQARLDGQPAHRALDQARQQLRQRAWPPGFAAAARPAYADCLTLQLTLAAHPGSAGAAADRALLRARQVGGWLLPEEVRNAHFGTAPARFGAHEHQRFSARWCSDPARREALASAVCQALFDGDAAWPAQAQAGIERLCASMVFFGRAAAATALPEGPVPGASA